MSDELGFFIFLLEQYANYKNMSADQILKMWDDNEVTDYIYNMYDRYHTEFLENAFKDIDKIIFDNKANN